MRQKIWTPTWIFWTQIAETSYWVQICFCTKQERYKLKTSYAVLCFLSFSKDEEQFAHCRDHLHAFNAAKDMGLFELFRAFVFKMSNIFWCLKTTQRIPAACGPFRFFTICLPLAKHLQRVVLVVHVFVLLRVTSSLPEQSVRAGWRRKKRILLIFTEKKKYGVKFF